MRALITGITGQTGSYLAELLVERGYEVCGLIRRTSSPLLHNLQAIRSRVHLLEGDMTDAGSLHAAVAEVQPDEIYNLAAMSHVRWSFDTPAHTLDVNAIGLARLLEAVRARNLNPRIYQAGSSEMFGHVLETPQTETTPFNPRSPYGVSKTSAFYLARAYREAYGLRIYNGILFNHESPRRGPEFLSRKVCQAVAAIACGEADHVTLGNLDASRDFGYAKEYAEWVWRIVQHDTPDDFVIATGETHTIREFVAAAFAVVGIGDWQRHVRLDERFMRPAEVNLLQGDSAKARRVLGYKNGTTFNELVRVMVEHEIAALRSPA